MNGVVEGGPMTGGVMTQPSQLTPAPPSIVDRVKMLEQTQQSHGENLLALDRMVGNLCNQIQELRTQLGLSPLEPDYFSSPT